jgi:hypothetical protein
VLVEVACIEEVGLPGKAVLVLLVVRLVLSKCSGFLPSRRVLSCAIKPCAIKVSAVKVGAGSCYQGRYHRGGLWIVLSRPVWVPYRRQGLEEE